jgi:hypothetical protein
MAADSLRVAVPSGMSFCWLLPCRRACSAVHSRRTSRCLRRSRPTCRRLASNAPGLRPLARSPARWLLAQQRRRAAAARSASEGQRRKARQKDAAPGRVESQSARGGRGTERLRRRAAWGARPRQCRHVRVLRTTGHARACRERSHDRPPRRRFPRAPQRPEEPGQGPGAELRFQGAQAGRQGQQRQVGGAPSWRRRAPASGPARGWDAATRRRASPGRS